MHLVTAAVCVLWLNAGVQRTDSDHEWLQLERARGTTVSLEDDAGGRTTGTLLRVETGFVVIRTDATDRVQERRTIRRITQDRDDSLKNGLILGSLIGAGMAAGSSCYRDDRKCGRGARAAFLALGAAIWGLFGTEIDRSVTKRVVLYERGASP